MTPFPLRLKWLPILPSRPKLTTIMVKVVRLVVTPRPRLHIPSLQVVMPPIDASLLRQVRPRTVLMQPCTCLTALPTRWVRSLTLLRLAQARRRLHLLWFRWWVVVSTLRKGWMTWLVVPIVRTAEFRLMMTATIRIRKTTAWWLVQTLLVGVATVSPTLP